MKNVNGLNEINLAQAYTVHGGSKEVNASINQTDIVNASIDVNGTAINGTVNVTIPEVNGSEFIEEVGMAAKAVEAPAFTQEANLTAVNETGCNVTDINATGANNTEEL